MKTHKSATVIPTVLVLALMILNSCTTPPATQSAATQAPTAAPTEAAVATPSQPAPAPTEVPPPTATAESAKGGSLVIGDPTEPDTLDSACTFSTWADNQFKALYDSLIFWGPDLEYHANLAKTWDVSADGLTYTFHLRIDVKFHDGTPFNAEAVKVNMDRIGKVECSVGKAAVELLGPSYVSTDVVDDYTVTIKFKAPYPKFLDSAAFLYFASPAALTKYGPDYGRHPVGTGPFVFKEWVDKDHLTLTRNPDYNWPPANAAHQGPAFLADVTWRFIPESSTLVSSLELGELQVIRGFQPTDVKQLESDANLTVFKQVPPGAPTGWNLNVQLAPLDDIKVRQAIGAALDKKTMIDTLFANNLTIAYGLITATTWSYWPGSEDYFKYDPELAKRLLDEAGWKDTKGDGFRYKAGKKLTLTLLDITDPQRQVAWEFFQAQLRQVGVDLQVQFAEAGVVFDDCVAGKPNICPVHWGLRDPAELDALWAKENIGTGFNWARIDDAQINQLLADGAKETDRAKRAKIYQDLQKRVMDLAVWLPMFDTPGFWAVHKSVQGAVILPSIRHIWLYDAYIQP
jgi:peptide/nickel transport system substrate-binding protein